MRALRRSAASQPICPGLQGRYGHIGAFKVSGQDAGKVMSMLTKGAYDLQLNITEMVHSTPDNPPSEINPTL